MSKLLTPLELKVMNILWKLKSGFVKDVVEGWLEQPVPAYNTVSTTIRILQEKGFVGFNSVGRGYEYYPLIGKFRYQQSLIVHVLENAFAGSASSLISALVSEEKISEQELHEIRALLDKKP